MDWAKTLTERYLSTPAVNWIRDNKINLHVDGKPLSYSRHHYDLAALIGRSIKRGKSLALFLPRLSDADLAFVMTFPYAIWIDVLMGLSLPGHWLNRRNIESKPHIMTIGHGPKQRQLLVNRTKFGTHAITNYMDVFWPQRAKKCKEQGLFTGVNNQLDVAMYIVPQSKISEDNFLNYSDECHPFVIFFDTTNKAFSDRQLKKHINICKEIYSDTPIIFLGALGNVSAIKILRDENISTWIMRANDIQRLDKHRSPDKDEASTGLSVNSQTLIMGITVKIQVIKDGFMDQWLGGLIELLHQIDQEIKKDNSGEDKALYYEAATILKEITALAVPLATQEELHQTERRSGLYATKMVRNNIENLDQKRGSVGKVNDLLNSFVRECTTMADVLAKPSAMTGKTSAVILWARQQEKYGITSIIACRNESLKHAMVTTLSRHGIDTLMGTINIVTHNEAWELSREVISPNTHLFWVGQLDYYSGAFFGGVFPFITILAYPCERGGIEQQLYYIDISTQKGSRRQGDKLLFLQDKNNIIQDKDVDPNAESQWKIQWQEIDCKGTYPGDVPVVAPFKLPKAEWIMEWLDNPPSTTPPPVCDTTHPCVVLTLSDGEADITLPLSASVMVLDEITHDTEGVIRVTNLKVGQTILVPRDDPKRTLLDRLADNLRNDPEFFLQEKMAERWYIAMETIRSRTGNNKVRAFKLLKKHNVSVETSDAIQGWFNYMVIGPRHLESLIAVAKAAEMPDIINNIPTIWGSIKYIRRVRKQLANQIAQYVRVGMSQQKDKLISKELKLYRSDLEELTRIGEILHIYQREKPN